MRVITDKVPNAEVIEQLEKLLETARAGDVQGLIFMTLASNQRIGTGWSGTVCDDVFNTLGALEHLKLRFWSRKIEP